jgi:hypothetical protein
LRGEINVLQETKSRSKRKRPTENWRTNGGLEAPTHLQNLKISRLVTIFQVFHGVEYP